MRFNPIAALATFAVLSAGAVAALWLLTPEPPPPCEAVASHCPGDAHALAEAVMQEAMENQAGRPTD